MTDYVAEAQGWLRDALALWAERGIDRDRGGFHEHLTFDGCRCTADFRRLRVLTRQIYAFSSPLAEGVPGCRQAAEFGLDFLLTKARHPEGGFASRFDLDGAIVDGTRDLYDLAFVLFALAHAYGRFGDARLRDEARTLIGFIVETMSHPAGGFLESLPPKLPRRQNPHMHLLEAMIFWSEADPEGPFTAVRDGLIDLFADRLFDPEDGILREYWADDLGRLAAPEGQLWEPGHHFEWVWLIDAAARRGARALPEAAAALLARGRRDGLHDGAGAIWGEVDASGKVTIAANRIWTLTEWLKAEAVTPGADREKRVAGAWAALAGFLAAPVRGLWFERWDPAKGGFVSEPAPATSLYHISMAVHALADAAGAAA